MLLAAGFDSQHWYRGLFDYGQPHNPAEADPADPDNDLIPQVGLRVPVAAWAMHSSVAGSGERGAMQGTSAGGLACYLPC